jgi:hypothetical protein
MKLLTFAHRGEAKAFLAAQTFNLDKSAPLADLFVSNGSYLLITGEGIETAMIKTAVALTYLNSKNELPKEVFNIGICGAIDPSQANLVGEVQEIRTVYAAREKTEFKSFTSASDSRTDLITTSERVLKPEQTERLLPIAKLVDREAWGVCLGLQQTFKLPFRCLKLVSDNVHHETEFCQRVKEKAEDYSIKLFQYYNEHYANEHLADSKQDNFLPKELGQLYFTQAQKNLFYSLCDKLKIEPTKVLDHYDMNETLESKKTPKEKTKVLIQLMQESLSPMLYKLRSQLEEKSRKSSNQNIRFNFDPNLEREDIHASIQFKTEDERAKVIEKLKNFPLEDFQKVYRGEF